MKYLDNVDDNCKKIGAVNTVLNDDGIFGKITTKIENIPDPNNPRTSRLAILSAIETLRSICTNDIKIGT